MKNSSGLNIIQALCAAAKIVVILLLPVASIMITVFAIPMTGLFMLRTSNLLILILLALYALLLVCAFLPRQISIIAGAAALVGEIVFLCLAPVIVQNSDLNMWLSLIRSLGLIPADYMDTAISVINAGVQSLAKPGLGLIINLLLSVVYIGASFIRLGVGEVFGGGSGASGGNRPSPKL